MLDTDGIKQAANSPYKSHCNRLDNKVETQQKLIELIRQKKITDNYYFNK